MGEARSLQEEAKARAGLGGAGPFQFKTTQAARPFLQGPRRRDSPRQERSIVWWEDDGNPLQPSSRPRLPRL